jgi:hypothetical protein
MAFSDLALLFFILVAFLLRRKGEWKRTALYVMGGVMLGDLTAATLIAVFHHFYPGILGWARYLMTLGAIIGGLYDWVKPTPQKPVEDINAPATPR